MTVHPPGASGFNDSQAERRQRRCAGDPIGALDGIVYLIAYHLEGRNGTSLCA